MTVQRIGIMFSEGMTAAEIAADYNLEPAEVHAALSYYLANREAIDADVRAQDEEYDRLAAAHPSLADRR